MLIVYYLKLKHLVSEKQQEIILWFVSSILYFRHFFKKERACTTLLLTSKVPCTDTRFPSIVLSWNILYVPTKVGFQK